MGIDFSHCHAHWAYSGFMHFRSRLAASLGYDIPLREMYDTGTYTLMCEEPIYPLIDHSDCDGYLQVDEMVQILPQLKQIINLWPDSDFDKSSAEELIEGMETAIECNAPMEFM